MKPLVFILSLSRTDSVQKINSMKWGNLSFELRNNGIRVNGSVGLNNHVLFDKLEYDENEGIVIAKSTQDHRSPLFLFNTKGDVAPNYDEVQGVVEDDGYKYLVAFKKRTAQNGLQLLELYLIDADDMKSTMLKYNKPTAHGIQCEFCELHHGIMILKLHEQYTFNAVHKYPGNFNYGKRYDSVHFLDGYRYQVKLRDKSDHAFS